MRYMGTIGLLRILVPRAAIVALRTTLTRNPVIRRRAAADKRARLASLALTAYNLATKATGHDDRPAARSRSRNAAIAGR